MIYKSFHRFVRLFQLCDLAWKSSNLQNKICSTDQIFLMTFQFQVFKVQFRHHFRSFLEFFDFPEPNFFQFKFFFFGLKISNLRYYECVLSWNAVRVSLANIAKFCFAAQSSHAWNCKSSFTTAVRAHVHQKQ